MDINAITIENARVRRHLPANLQLHVSFARNRTGIEEEDRRTEKGTVADIAVYPAEGITDSKTIQDSRSVGPYVLHVVNQSAMKRYEQAGSYRNWHPTTFEITV